VTERALVHYTFNKRIYTGQGIGRGVRREEKIHEHIHRKLARRENRKKRAGNRVRMKRDRKDE